MAWGSTVGEAPGEAEGQDRRESLDGRTTKAEALLCSCPLRGSLAQTMHSFQETFSQEETESGGEASTAFTRTGAVTQPRLQALRYLLRQKCKQGWQP